MRAALARGARVRALVRGLDRGVAALAKLGIDADSEKNLEFVVTDLWNLRDEVFDGVTNVISCTGTAVGPPGDTPDRAMYLQGVVFYPPVVLDETPENVEYVGERALANMAAEKLGGERVVEVVAHGGKEAFDATWGSLDDVVMGGISESNVRVEGGKMIFAGETSVLNSGGFASVRSVNFPRALDLSGLDGIRLRVKGDGNTYKFILRCEEKWDGVAQCFSFPTLAGKWVDVDIPFAEFKAVVRGNTVKDGPSADPAKICAMQIMLSKFEYDGELNENFTPGKFELQLDTIYGYGKASGVSSKKSSVPVYPKYVHLSAAGVTKLFRKNEYPGKEDVQPIVQMNDMLGRLIEWKFAGEDAVRMSMADAGYVVVRSTALTEEKAVGKANLIVEQGDNMMGQICRDDIAELLVESLFKPIANTTFEVASVRSGKAGDAVQQSFEGEVQLLKDSDTSRNFSAFPFIPK